MSRELENKANKELLNWFTKYNKKLQPEFLFGSMEALKIMYMIRLHKIKVESDKVK